VRPLGVRLVAVFLLWLAAGWLLLGWSQGLAFWEDAKRDLRPEALTPFGDTTPPPWAPIGPFLAAAVLAAAVLVLTRKLGGFRKA